MSRIDKQLLKMQQNPRDWRIEDIQTVATSLGIEWIHDGGSHVIFRSPTGEHLSIPAHRPIKPIYYQIFGTNKKFTGVYKWGRNNIELN